jgi:hypothetical protein
VYQNYLYTTVVIGGGGGGAGNGDGGKGGGGSGQCANTATPASGGKSDYSINKGCYYGNCGYNGLYMTGGDAALISYSGGGGGGYYGG